MTKAIIIGATSGIGRGLTSLLVEKGYAVAATGRRIDMLEELQKEHPSVLIKTMDINDCEATITGLNELIAVLGGLDLLILSSGIGNMNPTLEYDIEMRTPQTNVMGWTSIVVHIFKYFEQQKSGHLVAISSVAGLRGSRFAPSYGATKAYQINFLEGLRQKAGKLKTSVFVTDIRPGFVDTAMAQGAGIFWVASVEKASRQIFGAIRRKRKVAYVTKRWRIAAFVFRLIPRWLYDRA
ncbi:MAG: oxidoreductase [Bacteroidetes bacterium HGW-Bacteroidetes-6]|jgi:short-subunit dehydrogenase|nr:MAG: oxidoreductase [Bacteroidetes bacterium HGW-Bacteroidetes-6]